MRHSACVVILNGPNVLVVPRKSDPQLCGLPGGKVDDGERLEQAAVREVKEETGLDVEALDIVYQGNDGYGFIATCFLANAWSGVVSPRPGETQPRWGSWVELFERSPFSGYNRLVYSALKAANLLD